MMLILIFTRILVSTAIVLSCLGSSRAVFLRVCLGLVLSRDRRERLLEIRFWEQAELVCRCVCRCVCLARASVDVSGKNGLERMDRSVVKWTDFARGIAREAGLFSKQEEGDGSARFCAAGVPDGSPAGAVATGVG